MTRDSTQADAILRRLLNPEDLGYSELDPSGWCVDGFLYLTPDEADYLSSLLPATEEGA